MMGNGGDCLLILQRTPGPALAFGFRCPELPRRNPLVTTYRPASQQPDHELPSLSGASHS